MLPLKLNLSRSVPIKTSTVQTPFSEFSILKRIFGICALCVLTVWCVSACGLEPKQTSRAQLENRPETVRAVGLRKNLDPLTVVIGAERWGVMISNAQNAMELKHTEISEDELMRIDTALRSGVRDLLQLRDDLCNANEQPMQTCVNIDLPAWVMKPPNRVTSLDEYQSRSEWLGEVAGKFVQIGCEAGREVSDDEYLCAVE
ncbi:hypothetical protein [Hirschia litorea]|uniref:Uncharacterized protein n=1 Tax=Hirschia litorea TaxID=1199156 RepID=A0ABW2IIX8_9PROT